MACARFVARRRLRRGVPRASRSQEQRRAVYRARYAAGKAAGMGISTVVPTWTPSAVAPGRSPTGASGPFVPATPPRQVRAFAMHTRRSTPPGSRELPLRLRQADRRARASRIASSPDALHAEGDRTGVRAHSPRRGTFVAGRTRADFCDPSHVRTHAQSHAEIESSRARGPDMSGCEIRLATGLRAAAHTKYSKRDRCAYGHDRSRAGPPRLDTH